MLQWGVLTEEGLDGILQQQPLEARKQVKITVHRPGADALCEVSVEGGAVGSQYWLLKGVL